MYYWKLIVFMYITLLKIFKNVSYEFQLSILIHYQIYKNFFNEKLTIRKYFSKWSKRQKFSNFNFYNATLQCYVNLYNYVIKHS